MNSTRTRVTSFVALAVTSLTPLSAQKSQLGWDQIEDPDARYSYSVNVRGGDPELVFDHDVDAADLIDCGNAFSFPDLSVRAYRNRAGQIVLLLPTPGTRNPPPGSPYSTTEPSGNLVMIGDSFEIGGTNGLALVAGDCGETTGVVLNANYDGSPCNFDDKAWLASMYRVGDEVHGIVHDEYWGHQHDFDSGEPFDADCDTCSLDEDNCCNGLDTFKGFEYPADSVAASLWCKVTTLTHVVSTDDGGTFEPATDGPELVAAIPYRYDPGDTSYHACEFIAQCSPSDVDPTEEPGIYDKLCLNSPYPFIGMARPSNIVRPPKGHSTSGYYYMLVRQNLPPRFLCEAATDPGDPTDPYFWGFWAWENTILLRTDDLSDPSSWQAWGGSSFDRDFVSPYTSDPSDARDHVGWPLDDDWWSPTGGNPRVGYLSSSLTWNTHIERWILVDEAPVLQNGRPIGTGVYFTTSPDLLHWSRVQRVGGLEVIPGIPRPMYPSLIDHRVTGSKGHGRDNFDWSGDRAYIYYQKAYDTGSPHKADVWRVEVEISKEAL